MVTCKKGHEYRGDENYRARRGWCPVCNREVQRRYSRSEKGKARTERYERTEKAQKRYETFRETDKRADILARYDQSPKGWMNALRGRRTSALKRRKLRQEAEDLG